MRLGRSPAASAALCLCEPTGCRLGVAGSRPALGSQNSFMEIVVPTKIQGETSDNSEVEKEQVSYVIPIDEKLYTVHLKKRYFLADNFMVYLHNQGSVSTHSSDIMTQCYYQGYIEGYPNSVVALNTCFGLRGILQFENVSFAIEPLDSAMDFQHVIYKLGSGNNELGVFNKSNRGTEKYPVVYNIITNEKETELLPDLFPLYLEIHIVVDKALYDYLGSESTLVTNKVFEIISLVNSAFSQLKVTIVLTSLELWSDKNKISTVGKADELLSRFLEWKQSYLTLRPHDAAYLFIYRDYSSYVGATFPGKMCITPYSAGIILYPKGMTLDAFSVIFAQMLGLSLGIPYDDPMKCRCSEVICAMNLEALQSSGVKTFSNCSLRAFKKFIENVGAKCLQNKPQMQKSPRPVCGNGQVEGEEACDCGTAEQCGPASCCDPANCVLKQGSQCDSGPCCTNCQLSAAGTTCRPMVHPECDMAEVCNGSSPSCPQDIFVHNGQTCKNDKFFCYEGDCHDLDEKCEIWFGKGSRNAPFACYEEIQSQTDRFGNCGVEKNKKFKFCGWRNLICGRLICTYPFRTPYHRDNASVIYAFVRESVCITVDTGDTLRDPFVVRNGAHCDTERICVDRTCVESRMIKENAKTCAQRCSGHGVCNSQGVCNCSDGYQPPDCQTRSRRAFVTAKKGLIMDKASGNAIKNWLLTFYIVSPILIIASIIVMVWNRLKKWFAKEEEFLSNEFKSGGSTHSYLSRSRTETSSQMDTSK
ncbi:disintegrin and metalloproteinase domain-containing protein 32 [Sciurus carolinensis]|uniref:disintegrin and metalloproteinase domain-containing protein 32 n=1 Tax=Sciurus carolinensis TaxID=30640 RepID=UPI001FB1E585|nr:disintegrin and metalloproteinase domain-containing protein 32 [Sciurus carolinensis]